MNFPHSGITATDRINDHSEIVGLYGATSSGPFTGYARIGLKFINVSVPGSTETRTRGLNNGGEIVGRYTDSAGVIHGYSAK